MLNAGSVPFGSRDIVALCVLKPKRPPKVITGMQAMFRGVLKDKEIVTVLLSHGMKELRDTLDTFLGYVKLY